MNPVESIATFNQSENSSISLRCSEVSGFHFSMDSWKSIPTLSQYSLRIPSAGNHVLRFKFTDHFFALMAMQMQLPTWIFQQVISIHNNRLLTKSLCNIFIHQPNFVHCALLRSERSVCVTCAIKTFPCDTSWRTDQHNKNLAYIFEPYLRIPCWHRRRMNSRMKQDFESETCGCIHWARQSPECLLGSVFWICVVALWQKFLCILRKIS